MRLATLALVLALMAPATASAAPVSSCSYAKIGGERKCLRTGQFCTRSYQRQYLRHGFSCSSRDNNGRYHLRRA